MKKDAAQYINKSIYFSEPELLAAAIARAKSQRRSLSNYIAGLLEADLKNATEELKEKPNSAPNAHESHLAMRAAKSPAVSYLSPTAKKSAARKHPAPALDENP